MLRFNISARVTFGEFPRKWAGKGTVAVRCVLTAGLWCSMVALGCSGNDCEPPGFDQGERFRFTILSRQSEPAQECAPLDPGDSFELTAGEWRENSEQCFGRAAALTTFRLGEVDFAICNGSTGRTLGFGCTNSVVPNTCGPRLGMEVLSDIRRSDKVIDDALLRVDYRTADCTRSCVERFVVRIEILNRL